MIFDLIVGAFFSIVNGLLGLLPAGHPLDMSWLSSLIAYGRGFDAHLPVHELLALAGVLFGVLTAVWSFGVFIWLYKLLPFT
jgi:hypothetical protein